jgi:hypothetical protein
VPIRKGVRTSCLRYSTVFHARGCVHDEDLITMFASLHNLPSRAQKRHAAVPEHPARRHTVGPTARRARKRVSGARAGYRVHATTVRSTPHGSVQTSVRRKTRVRSTSARTACAWPRPTSSATTASGASTPSVRTRSASAP